MSILKSINEGFERRYGKLIGDRKQKEVKECDGECKGKKAEKELIEAPIYGLEAQYDSRKSFGGKAQVETDNAGTETLYSYNTPVVKIVNGKVTLLPKWDSSATTLRHVKEFLKQHDLKAESKEQIAKDYGARVAESCNKRVKECDEKDSKGAVVHRPAMKEACKKDKKPIKEYKDMGQDLGEYQKWVDYDMKRYHKISDKTMDKIKKAGLTVVKDQYGDYEVIAHEPVRECDDKEAKRRAIVKEAIDRTRAKRLQEAKKRTVVKEAVERVRARKIQESKNSQKRSRALNESFGTKVAKWYDDRYEYFMERERDNFGKYYFTIGKDSNWRKDFEYYMKDFHDLLDKYDPSGSEDIDKVVDSMSREDKEKIAAKYHLYLNENAVKTKDGRVVAKRTQKK